MIVKSRTYTFCGTPEYVAPEVIIGKGYGKAVDWWSFGVLVYELSAGYTPFTAKHQKEVYEKIIAARYKFPEHFSNDLKDLVKNLLQTDLSRRYGNLRSGVNDIKYHRWFKEVHWGRLYEHKLQPAFKPDTSGPGDVSNFDDIPDTGFNVAPTEQFVAEFKHF